MISGFIPLSLYPYHCLLSQILFLSHLLLSLFFVKKYLSDIFTLLLPTSFCFRSCHFHFFNWCGSLNITSEYKNLGGYCWYRTRVLETPWCQPLDHNSCPNVCYLSLLFSLYLPMSLFLFLSWQSKWDFQLILFSHLPPPAPPTFILMPLRHPDLKGTHTSDDWEISNLIAIKSLHLSSYWS